MKVLFVGSFKSHAADGSVGGQLFACNALVNSNIAEHIEFIKLDSTAKSVPAPPVIKRIPSVIKRGCLFCYHLIFSRIDACLIFSSAGYSFLEKGGMAMLASLLGKKVIFAPRSGLIEDDINKSAFMNWYVRQTLKRSDKVLCQSDHWKKYYQQLTKLNPKKFVVVKNWLRIKEYTDNLRSTFGKSNHRRSLLYLGWLEKHKGIFELLEAASLLNERNLDFELIIYGSGSQKGYAQEFIQIHGLSDRVFLKGWADHEMKLNALRIADAFVLPSHREGFPNALLEAMASRLPVVATKIRGTVDLLRHRENGILVEPGNVEQLSEALEEIIKNVALCETLATSGYMTVTEGNDVENVAKLLVDILEEP